MRATLFVLAAAGAAGTAAAATLTEHNFTISDMSPMLTYTNPGAWNASWTQSDWSTWVSNDTRMGFGDSMHTATEVGSSVTLSFVGTGVYFFGSADGGISLQVDSGPVVTNAMSHAVNTSVASSGGHEYGYHTAKLVLASGSELTLKNVVITTAIGGEGARVSNTSLLMYDDTPTAYLLNPNITLSSQQDWRILGSVSQQIGQSSYTRQYPRLSTSSSTAWMSFAVPANTSLMTLRGPVGYNYDKYKVTLDPAPPFGPASLTLTAQSPWVGFPEILWFASMDPTQQYKLTVDFLPGGTGDQATYFEATSAQFIEGVGGTGGLPGQGSTGGNNGTGNGTGHGDGNSNGSGSDNGTAKSNTNIGAIAGGAAGGAVALILAGVLLWWCLRKRRNQRNNSGKKRVVGTLLDPKRRESAAGSDFEIEPLDPLVSAHQMGAYAGSGYGGSAHSLPSGSVTPLPPPANSLLTQPTPAQSYASPSSPVESYTATPALALHTKAALAGGAAGSVAGSSAKGHGYGDQGWGRPLPSAPSAPSSYSHSPSQPYPSSYSSSSHGGPVTPATASSHGGGKARYEPPHAPQPVVNVEQDAGRVPAPAQSPADSVPPTYDPRWANE